MTDPGSMAPSRAQSAPLPSEVENAGLFAHLPGKLPRRRFRWHPDHAGDGESGAGGWYAHGTAVSPRPFADYNERPP
jgi:hypothetical protein